MLKYITANYKGGFRIVNVQSVASVCAVLTFLLCQVVAVLTALEVPGDLVVMSGKFFTESKPSGALSNPIFISECGLVFFVSSDQ